MCYLFMLFFNIKVFAFCSMKCLFTWVRSPHCLLAPTTGTVCMEWWWFSIKRKLIMKDKRGIEWRPETKKKKNVKKKEGGKEKVLDLQKPTRLLRWAGWLYSRSLRLLEQQKHHHHHHHYHATSPCMALEASIATPPILPYRHDDDELSHTLDGYHQIFNFPL